MIFVQIYSINIDPNFWPNYTSQICKIGETFPNQMNYNNCLFYYDKNASSLASRPESEKKLLLINNYQKEFQKVLLNAFSKYESGGGTTAPFFYTFYSQEKMIFMTAVDNLTVLNEFILWT